MLLNDGDYSDLIVYLAGLFSIKKIGEISIDRYRIRYESSFIMEGNNTDRVFETRSFPENDQRDRIKSMTLSVRGMDNGNDSTVKITWDYIEIEPDVHAKAAREFVEILDRSTFRYF